ncbi:MAG: hypothetical protein M5U01_10020 [Ardenticatenaceae bacterium]|nr:hypothetical protein [Ardenticatenaceae bacterium]
MPIPARDEARVIALVEVLQTIIGPHHPGRRVRSYREGARGGWSEIRAAATRARAGNDWSPPTGLGPQTTQGGTMLCSCRDHDVPAAAAECDACRWQREQRAARLHYRTFRRQLRRTRDRRRAWHLARLVARAVMEGRL